MQEWIQQILSAQPFGLAAVPAVFLLGLLAAVTSCCTLPVLGAVAGYAGTLGERRSRGGFWWSASPSFSTRSSPWRRSAP